MVFILNRCKISQKLNIPNNFPFPYHPPILILPDNKIELYFFTRFPSIKNFIHTHTHDRIWRVINALQKHNNFLLLALRLVTPEGLFWNAIRIIVDSRAIIVAIMNVNWSCSILLVQASLRCIVTDIKSMMLLLLLKNGFSKK